MQVNEAMTSDVKIANPNQTIRDAARLMAQIDAGVLPVGENDRLVGMITDRDIAIRAVGAGKGPQTPVREVMSSEVMYCFEDDDLDEVVQNMADIKVRRLPVLDRDKRLVGILSLGDIALTEGAGSAGSALCGISDARRRTLAIDGQRTRHARHLIVGSAELERPRWASPQRGTPSVNQGTDGRSCRPYFGQTKRTGRSGRLPSTLRRTRWDGFSRRLSLPLLC
jgi:CBS domain-containing protein